MSGQGFFQAVTAFAVGIGAVAASEIGDAAAAGGDQQIGGLAGAVAVVAEDAVDAGGLDDPAHHDDRHAEAGAALGDLQRCGAGGDDHGVGLVVERAHQPLVHRIVAQHRADQQPPVAPRQGFGEGVEEQGIENVAGAAHDQGNQVGAIADQAAGQGVGPVAEPFGRRQHLGAGLGGGAGTLGEDARNGRGGNACGPGHVLDRHSAHGVQCYPAGPDFANVTQAKEYNKNSNFVS